MRRELPLALLVLVLGLLTPSEAKAFCRTTTTKIPAGYDPTVDGCITTGFPLYWANACVSYDIQQSASTQLSCDDAAVGIATAFSKWTGSMCDSTESGRVSIDVRDFGPVACNQVQYNQNGPNQHVIIFRDDAWPYMDSANRIALTTVTFNTLTGEIYDADMEINTHDYTLSVAASVASGGYDFASIVTHETGHFLGMAHSDDYHATMYAQYSPGDEVMRSLTVDDTTGICSIYRPDGTRSVATAAAPSGSLAELTCDPTPRHGFTSQCMTSGGCSISARGVDAPSFLLPLVPLAFLRARKRRRID
jgi:hypothetical protein